MSICKVLSCCSKWCLLWPVSSLGKTVRFCPAVFCTTRPNLPVQFSSAAQSCLTLCNPIDCSMPDSLPITNSWSLPILISIELLMPSNHLILYHPLLLPSVFPSTRVFSSESVLYTRWPKYWSFSFNISPSNKCSGLISLSVDWLDLLIVQGTQESSPTPQFKSIISSALSFLYGPTLTSICDYWKNHSFDWT